MNILVIGGNGFIGKHLINNLINQKNNKIFSLDLSYSKIEDLFGNFKGDIKNAKFISKCITKAEPDLVYYLVSFFPFDNIENISLSIKNSLVSLENLFKCLNSKTRLVYIGSSSQYGNVPSNNQPVNEKCEFFPVSHYGIFKIFEEYEIRRLANKYNIDVVGARVFNVTGPGEPIRMIGGSIISQLKKGIKIKVGNLDSKRDFLDVRDVANALAIIGIRGKSNEIYNVCSGKTISIKKFLELIIFESRLNPTIVVDKKRMNPNDIKNLVGDNNKLLNELNWKIKYDIVSSIRELVKDIYL